MALVGPDGKPLTGRIIGQPQTLAKMPPFCKADLEQLIDVTEQMLQQGTPHEVPVALPLNNVARLAVTIRTQRSLLERLFEVAKENELWATDPDLFTEVSDYLDDKHAGPAPAQ